MSGTTQPRSASRLAASFAGSSARPAPPLSEQQEPAAPLAALRAAAAASAVPRIKQTVELPEDVYDAVQDFAREHRTSFQVVMRALIDDLVGAGDEAHRGRVDALIQVAEQEKRDRRRNRGRVQPKSLTAHQVP